MFKSVLVATLDTGDKLAFTPNMAREFCPIVGMRVEKKNPIERDSNQIGKHYCVSRTWRIWSEEALQDKIDQGKRIAGGNSNVNTLDQKELRETVRAKAASL